MRTVKYNSDNEAKRTQVVLAILIFIIMVGVSNYIPNYIDFTHKLLANEENSSESYKIIADRSDIARSILAITFLSTVSIFILFWRVLPKNSVINISLSAKKVIAQSLIATLFLALLVLASQFISFRIPATSLDYYKALFSKLEFYTVSIFVTLIFIYEIFRPKTEGDKKNKMAAIGFAIMLALIIYWTVAR